jgi:hypothetical protein
VEISFKKYNLGCKCTINVYFQQISTHFNIYLKLFLSFSPGDIIYFTKINACWHQREIIRRKNYIIQLPILASLIVYTTHWELHLLVINLKGSIYYFINNIWYKYTGIQKQRQIFNGWQWQKITNTVTQKTEDWATQTPLKLWTDMNSDAPYESAVRTSLITLHGKRSWGQLPFPLWKVEGGKANLPPFFALNLGRIYTSLIKFKKKNFFCLL